ncbi:MAG: ComF family protein [Mobilitalea sp.]
MFQTILDIIYPVRCPVCMEIATPKGNRVCPNCKGRLPYIQEPRCLKCSKPLEVEEKEYCSDCESKDFHFNRGYAVWVYNKMMMQSISAFKYKSKKEYAAFYTEEIITHYKKQLVKLNLDGIVPVPLHRTKYRERGYNQATLLAKGIGEELDIPVLNDLLIRTKKTVPQKTLNDVERLHNLMEAFQYNKETKSVFRSDLSRVLLVDDIYTTGSTMEACTNVLKENGIKEVYFMVLCIGKGF